MTTSEGITGSNDGRPPHVPAMKHTMIAPQATSGSQVRTDGIWSILPLFARKARAARPERVSSGADERGT
jgi:hypothetical protein